MPAAGAGTRPSSERKGLGDGVTEGFVARAPELEVQSAWEAESDTLFEDTVLFLLGPV